MISLLGQFLRFSMVGVSSSFVQFSTLICLVHFFYVKPIIASALGYLSGAVVNYLLNHYFTFKSTLSHQQALVRFFLNSLFGFFLNLIIMMFLLTHYAYVLSQVLTSIIILFWNFIIHRVWTFQSKK